MSVFSWWFWAWLIFGPGPIPILGLSAAKLTGCGRKCPKSSIAPNDAGAVPVEACKTYAIHFGKKMAGSIRSLYILCCRNFLERIGYRIPSTANPQNTKGPFRVAWVHLEVTPSTSQHVRFGCPTWTNTLWILWMDQNPAP